MSIIAEKTLEQRRAQQVLDLIRHCKTTIVDTLTQGNVLLWSVEGDVTCKDVMDALGTDAAEVLQLSALLNGLLATAGAPLSLESMGNWTPTLNQDGTVSVQGTWTGPKGEDIVQIDIDAQGNVTETVITPGGA